MKIIKKYFKSTSRIDGPKNIDRRASIVLLISGLFGFYLGAFAYPTIQYGVEYAQAVSGIIKYPAGIPEGLIKTHIWSLPTQLTALGLMAGLSEDTLSVLLSGLHGMLSLQAIGLLLFAISGRVWLSSFAPVLFLYSRVTAFESVYPVLLMGFFATPGALGLSYVLFLLAVFGVGWKRLGALLLGMAPAWHGVLGGLMWVALLAGWGLGNKSAKEIKSLAIWFSAGVLIALTSLYIHFSHLPPLPDVPSAEVKRLFIHFIHMWDYHRKPINFSSPETFLNLMGLAVCGISLRKLGCTIPERVRLILRALIITGILALAFGVMTHIPVSWVPAVLIRAMPARLLDVFVIGYPTILLGMLTREGARPADQFFATGMIILLFMMCFFWRWFIQSDTFYVLIAGGVMAITAAIYPSRVSEKAKSRPRHITTARLAQVIIVVAVAALSLTGLRTAFMIPTMGSPIFTNNTIRKETAGPDVLLVSSAVGDHAQYHFRRPILLDVSELDTLCYMPKLLPAAASILKDVYGIDFFNPPYESRHVAALSPPGIERKLWESWSLEKWGTVRKNYHVSSVLVPSGWKLALPVEWSKFDVTIYHIPIEE